jgi:hypothetical protein
VLHDGGILVKDYSKIPKLADMKCGGEHIFLTLTQTRATWPNKTRATWPNNEVCEIKSVRSIGNEQYQTYENCTEKGKSYTQKVLILLL